MLKSRFLSGFSLALLAYGLSAQAESEIVPASDDTSDAIVIDGDKLELHLDRQMRALGNASLSRGNQTILG
ncbi:MAG: hypothetical protein V4493_06060, partial [Pseudomonadota bacterium]